MFAVKSHLAVFQCFALFQQNCQFKRRWDFKAITSFNACCFSFHLRSKREAWNWPEDGEVKMFVFVCHLHIVCLLKEQPGCFDHFNPHHENEDWHVSYLSIWKCVHKVSYVIHTVTSLLRSWQLDCHSYFIHFICFPPRGFLCPYWILYMPMWCHLPSIYNNCKSVLFVDVLPFFSLMTLEAVAKCEL